VSSFGFTKNAPLTKALGDISHDICLLSSAKRTSRSDVILSTDDHCPPGSGWAMSALVAGFPGDVCFTPIADISNMPYRSGTGL